MFRDNNSLADQVITALTERAEENPYLRQVVRTSIPSADCVRVHLRGKEVCEATRDLIASAEEEVLMQFYGLTHDTDSGRDLKSALIDLNKKAVASNKTIDVKILVNFRRGLAALFTRSTDHPFAWIEEGENGKYFMLDGCTYYLDGLNIETALHEHQLFDSFHTKQIIVDRKTIMIRGCDISSRQNYRDAKKRWTELSTTIESADLAEAAARSFHANLQGNPCSSKISYVASAGGIPVILLEKNSNTNPFIPKDFRSPLKCAVIECMNRAKASIKIATSNINDPDILDAIIAAANRDVTVTLITGEHHNDDRENKPGMGGTNVSAVNYVYEHLPISKRDYFQTYWPHERGLANSISYETALHTKLTIIDDCVVLTGSTPLDKQGTYYSAESDVMIESEEVAKIFLDKVFNPLINEGHSNSAFQLKVFQYALKDDIHQAFLDLSTDDDCLKDLEHIIGCINNASNFICLCVSLKTLIEHAQASIGTASNTGLFSNNQHMQTLRRICAEHYIDCDNNENQSFGKK